MKSGKLRGITNIMKDARLKELIAEEGHKFTQEYQEYDQIGKGEVIVKLAE